MYNSLRHRLAAVGLNIAYLVLFNDSESVDNMGTFCGTFSFLNFVFAVISMQMCIRKKKKYYSSSLCRMGGASG